MVTGRRFAVFDIDGTLVRWQLYHAVADALAKQGLIDSKTYRVILNARMQWKQRSHKEAFKDYERQLVKVYEQLLKSLSIEQFNSATNSVFEEYKDQVYTYTRNLISQLKQNGYLLFAISGSQTEIVEKIAKYYDFDDYVGSNYERQGSGFSGQKITHLSDKHKVLEDLLSKHQVTWAKSIAVGDSASDISMLEMVEEPIAFNPEKKLFDQARQKGWKVVIERKNMVYELNLRHGKYLLA